MVTPVKSEEHYLFYKEGGSDKVYHCWIEQVGANNSVVFEYGRRGSTLNKGKKIEDTHRAKAETILLRLVNEKLSKGYSNYDPKTGVSAVKGVSDEMIKKALSMIDELRVAVATTSTTPEPEMVISSPQLLNVITEPEVESYIKDNAWCLQDKFDGIRMMLNKSGNKITAANKKGQLIEPPEEFAACCKEAFANYDFIIDGEACGERYFAFDLISLEGVKQIKLPLEERLANLGMLIRSGKKQSVIMEVYTSFSTAEKRGHYLEAKRENKEGVVIKDKTIGYTAGRPASGGPAFKLKFTTTADVVVTEITKGKRSFQMGMQNGKNIVLVGNCTVPVNKVMPKKGDIIEVRYLNYIPGGSLYQPVMARKRDDAVSPDALSTLKLKNET